MKSTSILIISFTFLLAACSVKPRPIQEGVDSCSFCKMTVMDKKYATEIVSTTGKVYVFDDAHCMHTFLEQDMMAKKDVKLVLLTDYNHPDNLLLIEDAILFTSDHLKTPMNGKIIALSDSNALNSLMQSMQGRSIPVHNWLP